jgi:hypothetical protein
MSHVFAVADRFLDTLARQRIFESIIYSGRFSMDLTEAAGSSRNGQWENGNWV